MRLPTAVVVVAVCLGLGGGGAYGKSKKPRKHHHHHHKRSDPLAEGRNHLKKANTLAGEGDCAAAIDEYSAAYEALEDPVVLFNRGECYRRTREADKAVADYRAFLEKVPQARNRADIEAKIAKLAPPEPEPEEAASLKPPPAPPPPVVAAPVTPAPPVATAAAPMAVERPAETTDTATEGSGGIRWWAWGVLGALVVAGTVAGVVMFRPQESQPPDSTWGNYRF